MSTLRLPSLMLRLRSGQGLRVDPGGASLPLALPRVNLFSLNPSPRVSLQLGLIGAPLFGKSALVRHLPIAGRDLKKGFLDFSRNIKILP